MNYYIDTEFLEGTQDKQFLGIKYGKTKPTIDLISIGIVSEDNREYYAISNEFNLKEAWNRYDLKQDLGKPQNLGNTKEYWLRDNVLFPIWKELSNRDYLEYNSKTHGKVIDTSKGMTYKSLKQLIDRYGKSNKQIAEEVKEFIQDYKFDDTWEYGDRYDSLFGNGINNTYYFVKDDVKSDIFIGTSKSENKPVFYGYYCDYDWVVFCWLFGKMADLPDGFPYYCIDLKQIADEKAVIYDDDDYSNLDLHGKVKYLESNSNYPKQTNEHNALADAKWNKEFHTFLNIL